MGAPNKIIVGADILVFVNGLLYGQTFGFVWSSSTPLKEIQALDSSIAAELASGRGHVAGSVQIFRLKGDGGAEGVGMAVPYAQLPRGRYFNLLVFERSTGSIIFAGNYCKASQQQWNVSPKNYITGTLTWQGLDWTNEVTTGTV